MTLADMIAADAEAGLDAFLRSGDVVPEVPRASLIGAISALRGSGDPMVTFAGLARACVPLFADGCEVALDDGTEPPFRVRHEADPAGAPRSATTPPAGPWAPESSPGRPLLTPFRVTSWAAWPSYAGVVTHWWDHRAPDGRDALIADLMVKHAIALVDRERLAATVGKAEDRAAGLALRAISGRAFNLATGIVMHHEGLAAEAAESRLRQAASDTGADLAEVAARVLRGEALFRDSGRDARPGQPGTAPQRLALAVPTANGASRGTSRQRSRGDAPTNGGTPRR
jgi:hypothetical protein